MARQVLEQGGSVKGALLEGAITLLLFFCLSAVLVNYFKPGGSFDVEFQCNAVEVK